MAIEHVTLGEIGGVTFRLAESSYAGRFSQEELEAAFAMVQNREDWKSAVSCTIPATMRDVVAAAVEHFLGSEATFEAEGSAYLRVRAASYYAAVGS